MMCRLFEKVIEEPMLDHKDAATYVGMAPNILRNQLRSGGGPARVRISPHKTMFRRADLDAWKASWQVIEANR